MPSVNFVSPAVGVDAYSQYDNYLSLHFRRDGGSEILLECQEEALNFGKRGNSSEQWSEIWSLEPHWIKLTKGLHAVRAGYNTTSWTIDVGENVTNQIRTFLLLCGGEGIKISLWTGFWYQSTVMARRVYGESAAPNLTFTRSGTTLKIDSNTIIYGGVTMLWM